MPGVKEGQEIYCYVDYEHQIIKFSTSVNESSFSINFDMGNNKLVPFLILSPISRLQVLSEDEIYF